MKAFERIVEPIFSYPEDMEQIIKYLKKHGTINVSLTRLEELYYEFSDTVYSASWIIVSEHTLGKFADWLEEKEV